LLAYGFDLDPQAAIERMTEGEIETLILHEEGELAAGRLLGGAWADKLAGLGGKRAEIFARAVKDNLADCLVTLPGLLARGGGRFAALLVLDLRRSCAARCFRGCLPPMAQESALAIRRFWRPPRPDRRISPRWPDAC
jgi:hypothetical protein